MRACGWLHRDGVTRWPPRTEHARCSTARCRDTDEPPNLKGRKAWRPLQSKLSAFFAKLFFLFKSISSAVLRPNHRVQSAREPLLPRQPTLSRGELRFGRGKSHIERTYVRTLGMHSTLQTLQSLPL